MFFHLPKLFQGAVFFIVPFAALPRQEIRGFLLADPGNDAKDSLFQFTLQPGAVKDVGDMRSAGQ
jgi:hypothetical protein